MKIEKWFKILLTIKLKLPDKSNSKKKLLESGLDNTNLNMKHI